MKKLLCLALCAGILVCLAACGKTPAGSGSGTTSTPAPAPGSGTETEATGGALIPNPFVDYDSLEAAVKAAGFSFTVPETLAGYPEKIVQLMGGKMLQVIFRSDEGDRVFLRKEKGSDDISGDYNVYAQTEVTQAGSTEVTLKGNDDTVSTAVWTRDGYAFAVTADKPMTRQAMLDLIGQIG